MRICQIQYNPNVAICQQSYIVAKRGKLNIRTEWEFHKLASGKILLFYKSTDSKSLPTKFILHFYRIMKSVPG